MEYLGKVLLMLLFYFILLTKDLNFFCVNVVPPSFQILHVKSDCNWNTRRAIFPHLSHVSLSLMQSMYLLFKLIGLNVVQSYKFITN